MRNISGKQSPRATLAPIFKPDSCGTGLGTEKKQNQIIQYKTSYFTVKQHQILSYIMEELTRKMASKRRERRCQLIVHLVFTHTVPHYNNSDHTF